MQAASFINLDLELLAPTPLDQLTHYFAPSCFVLFSGEEAGAYRLAVEPMINGALSQDATACTRHFLKLIQALPIELRPLWNKCTTRAFDYGFDSGDAAPPLTLTLAAAELLSIAQYGIDFRITIYPSDASIENESDCENTV